MYVCVNVCINVIRIDGWIFDLPLYVRYVGPSP